MILGLQVIALIFALIMLYFTYLHFRRTELNSVEVIIMFAAWLGAILIIAEPNIFSIFSRTIAISRAFDLAVIGGFIFVIPLVYLSYIRTRRLEKKVEEFVREEVLNAVKSSSIPSSNRLSFSLNRIPKSRSGKGKINDKKTKKVAS